MTVDKKISYGTIKDPTFNIYKKGGPVEDKPKPNVIEFPIKPGMPLHDWYKSNKDSFTKVASVEELGPFLTKYYSEKELRKMTDEEIESLLQDLLEKGLL